MTRSARQAAVLASALALGAVAGMRSQMPFALMAWQADKGRFAANGGPPLSILRTPAARTIATVAAVGELVGDKLPMTPSRLDPGPLAARFLIGGLAGAAVLQNAGKSSVAGALAGVAGAGVGAFSGYHIRRSLVVATNLPDPVVAVVEDLAAIGIGAAALRGERQRNPNSEPE